MKLIIKWNTSKLYSFSIWVALYIISKINQK